MARPPAHGQHPVPVTTQQLSATKNGKPAAAAPKHAQQKPTNTIGKKSASAPKKPASAPKKPAAPQTKEPASAAKKPASAPKKPAAPQTKEPASAAKKPAAAVTIAEKPASAAKKPAAAVTIAEKPASAAKKPAAAVTIAKPPQVRAPPRPEYGCCEQTDVQERGGDWRCDSCNLKVHYDCESSSKSKGSGVHPCSKCHAVIMSSERRAKRARPT
jgi:hypothetical protein